MSALSQIIEHLATRSRPLSAPYAIPGLWVDGRTTNAQQVDPYAFYQARLSEIAARDPQPLVTGSAGGGWSDNAVIYNLFPRVTTAFDHAADGTLSLGVDADGWRETGTLLKCIAILPYIRGMGFNTVHLLPITAVGQDGKKGTLGSPYAIRNPYQLDENLNEPALGLTIDQLFAGFVEAAHRLGLRVIMEFVLRTSSKDGDWIQAHPDWFYWIREDVPDRAPAATDPHAYGNPIFAPDVLTRVKAKVHEHDFRDLPAPPDSYRAFYTMPPEADAVTLENGRYVGTLKDGTRVRIPGAFADWPPDDNQPPWGDVTYLRMFMHPDFNYIAYNTIRMYDERSAQPEYRNAPLWEAITGVIPHYQAQFGIDGVMIDMGHALPQALKQEVVAAARTINPDFAFWDENFLITPQSRAEGYNAVMGYLLFDIHQPAKVSGFIREMASHPFAIRFFGAPENHNTPRATSRAGGLRFARYALTVCATIPAMPFVLSGFELGETQPINTGLGFSNEMLARYPSDALPLFSAYAFNWTRSDNLVEAVRATLALRQRDQALYNDSDPATFTMGYADNPSILVYSRHTNSHASAPGDSRWISVIANVDMDAPQNGRVVIDAKGSEGVGLLGVYGNVPITDETLLIVALDPGQVLVIAR